MLSLQSYYLQFSANFQCLYTDGQFKHIGSVVQ